LESLKHLTIKPNSIWNPNSGIPWEDVAAILAKASDLAASYGRYKYCLEKKWKVKLLRPLFEKAIDLKWNKTISHEDVYNIVSLALEEMTNPSVCPKCNGRKDVIILDKIYKCDLCLGFGRKSMSDLTREKYLSKNRNVFYRHIKYNYFNTILPMIEEWELELQRVFNPYRRVK
tara:strand:+ start:79 stop:600 length:522 start_codon:yes stop_codon:yes gene_type:complete